MMNNHILHETQFEPLSLEEQKQRKYLEQQIQKAFYQAGLALQTIRDKKLYRSTHSTFEEYCHDRFGFTRRSAYYLIDAVKVVDNLKKCEPMVHILPVNERQCRTLKSLKPEQQREAWNLAISVANNQAPSGTIVKKVVNQIKTGKTPATDKENHNNRREGINYVRGVGVEWYVRVDEETWHQLKIYAEKVGTATLSGAIGRLLAVESAKNE